MFPMMISLECCQAECGQGQGDDVGGLVYVGGASAADPVGGAGVGHPPGDGPTPVDEGMTGGDPREGCADCGEADAEAERGPADTEEGGCGDRVGPCVGEVGGPALPALLHFVGSLVVGLQC